jgi:hypothetical protein
MKPSARLMHRRHANSWIAITLFVLLVGATAAAFGAANEPVLALAKKEKPALLDTLKELCSIESGSSDREGLDRIAAFAGVSAKGPVIESFGLRGFGSHSINAEYISIDSIEPRLYLATRMIMDVAQGKAPLK